MTGVTRQLSGAIKDIPLCDRFTPWIVTDLFNEILMIDNTNDWARKRQIVVEASQKDWKIFIVWPGKRYRTDTFYVEDLGAVLTKIEDEIEKIRLGKEMGV